MTPAPARGLRRAVNPMPPFVRRALVERGLMAAYRARPPYQRNDYLGWIARAKRPETQERRLAQMLDELARGDRYMKMIRAGSSALVEARPPRQRNGTGKHGASPRGPR